MKESDMKHGKRDFHSQWIFMIPNYGLVSCTSKNVIEAHEEDEKNTKTPFRIHCQLLFYVSSIVTYPSCSISFFTFRKNAYLEEANTLESLACWWQPNYVKMLRSVCNQPRILYFLDFLEGLDHVLGYYIATHCWWATVSYVELRNKGHVWLAESNSKILVFYWLIQKAIRSAWN